MLDYKCAKTKECNGIFFCCGSENNRTATHAQNVRNSITPHIHIPAKVLEDLYPLHGGALLVPGDGGHAVHEVLVSTLRARDAVGSLPGQYLWIVKVGESRVQKE